MTTINVLVNEMLRLAHNLLLVAKANEMEQTVKQIRQSIYILETLAMRDDDVEGVPV